MVGIMFGNMLALVLYSLLGVVFAKPQYGSVVRRQESTTTTARGAEPTVCGELIDYVNQGYIYFDAEYAYDCLASVPFNAAVALRFIDYFNTTIQFQSTLAYLKDPPQGYQQPPVDILGGLQKIKDNIGAYKSQYAFEADMQYLAQSAHDDHLYFSAGIMSAFSFSSQHELVTVSTDGKSDPLVYVAQDVRMGLPSHSPIESINGEGATQYLARYAARNSMGKVEPHADWNSMMTSPPSIILGEVNTLYGLGTFYEGPWMNLTFSNGTFRQSRWVAIYNYQNFTGPLTTGGDFYNFFVLGLAPASYHSVPLPCAFNETACPNSTTSSAPNIPNVSYDNGWDNYTLGMYPKADIVQPNLESLGWITGYYLPDVSAGVLSIPSFDETGWGVENFTNTVASFITGASEKDLSNIIIDVQGNSGGAIFLAFDIFAQFFPDATPFAGSRRRSHPWANVLGNTLTNTFNNLSDTDDEYYDLLGSEWVIQDRINAQTGRNFASWPEYFGPRAEKGDLFSLVERYNLTDEQFDGQFFDGQSWSGHKPEEGGATHWSASQIVLLTDGACSSACTLFTEMMTQIAGVRTVVVGGQPKSGPMQAASGTRGALPYSADYIDYDVEYATSQNESTVSELPSRVDTGIWEPYISFNLRDQVRTANSPAVPLQFTYEAADCRLYFTVANVFNMSRLWRDVAAAAWGDGSLCVAGSTGYSTTGNKTASKPPPSATATPVSLPQFKEPYDLGPLGLEDNSHDYKYRPSATQQQPLINCMDNQSCSSGLVCRAVRLECTGSRGSYLGNLTSVCVKSCTVRNKNGGCGDTASCSDYTFQETANHPQLQEDYSAWTKRGYCVPNRGTKATGCSA